MAQDASFISPSAVTADERAALLRLAYRVCWNGQEAEDVVQDALLAAARHGEKLRDSNRRWPWLCRIVVQQCRLHARRNRRERQRAVLNILAEPASDQREPAPGPDELGVLMKRLLVLLPEKQRIAVTLRHLENMDYARTAEIMHVSESTVRASVQAGRENLRRLILARHPEWQS